MFDKLKKAFGGSSEPEAPKVEEKVEAAAPVETKAPAAVKRKARAKKKSETQTSNNEENK